MRKLYLFVDQYGNRIQARTVKELKEQVGPGKVSKMYVDSKTKGTLHVGYVVGKRWFTQFERVERQA